MLQIRAAHDAGAARNTPQQMENYNDALSAVRNRHASVEEAIAQYNITETDERAGLQAEADRVARNGGLPENPRAGRRVLRLAREALELQTSAREVTPHEVQEIARSYNITHELDIAELEARYADLGPPPETKYPPLDSIRSDDDAQRYWESYGDIPRAHASGIHTDLMTAVEEVTESGKNRLDSTSFNLLNNYFTNKIGRKEFSRQGYQIIGS